MPFTLNDNIPCGTEACATSKHESSACNSVDNILLSGIKDIKKALSDIEGKFDNIKVDLTPVAKEATLLAKVAELKEALNSIDFTAIEQAIQGVEDVTAREATLIQGVGEIIKAVNNIDFTDLANSIAEVKNAVANIDLSSVESKVEEVGNKIDNIKLPEIDTTELAKQGENQDATLTAILAEIKAINDLKNIYSVRFEQNSDGDNTWTMVMPVVSGVIMNEDDTVTIQM